MRWLAWHLDRFGNERADERLIDRAAYLWRDGLQSVVGLDESGHMDAMGLAWVVMAPEGDRPLILQKAGGLQGILSYVAFAPSRNVGLMIAINAFYVNAFRAMASAANALIAELAPGQTREGARTQGGHQLADDTKFFRSATPRLCSRARIFHCGPERLTGDGRRASFASSRVDLSHGQIAKSVVCLLCIARVGHSELFWNGP